ncbi:PO113 protein, partial [Indicator maculatus]|nr:PO113 protein [Indicator maculatus]
PIKYLGWTLAQQTISPQKLHLSVEIQTLNDMQRFMGDIQWLRPFVGIPNEMLDPL